MRPTCSVSTGVAVALGAVVAFGGCSAGTYDKDYASRVAAYRGEAVFAVLTKDPVGEGRVRVRLPRQLAPMEDDDGSKIRALPPFVRTFPGHVGSQEVKLAAGNAQLPVVLSLGIVPTAVMRHADVEKTILDQVRANESFTKAAWEKGRTVEPVAGGPAVWDVLSLEGQQEFESLTAGNPEYKQWPGTCEIWVSADPKQEFCAVLALRAPVDVVAQLQARPAELVELVARTVEILPPADEKPAADGPPAK